MRITWKSTQHRNKMLHRGADMLAKYQREKISAKTLRHWYRVTLPLFARRTENGADNRENIKRYFWKQARQLLWEKQRQEALERAADINEFMAGLEEVAS